MVAGRLVTELYNTSPLPKEYNKDMDKNAEKSAWKERGGRMLRGAAVVGALAVGVAIIF